MTPKNGQRGKAHPWHVLCRIASIRSYTKVSGALRKRRAPIGDAETLKHAWLDIRTRKPYVLSQ